MDMAPMPVLPGLTLLLNTHLSWEEFSSDKGPQAEVRQCLSAPDGPQSQPTWPFPSPRTNGA